VEVINWEPGTKFAELIWDNGPNSLRRFSKAVREGTELEKIDYLIHAAAVVRTGLLQNKTASFLL
jgi:hypothetical protein